MIRNVLARDLRAVAREVDAYPDDEALWRTAPGITNSAGTLALHLAGNLEHFIGGVLGRTGYVRDREAEFATRDLTRAELRGRIGTAAFLVHLATHLAYHLGQIDYHRRLLVPDQGTVDAMSIGELPQR